MKIKNLWNKIVAKAKIKAKKPKPLTKRIAAKVAQQITKQTTKDVARQIQQLYLEHLKKKITLKELKAMLLYLIDDYVLVTYKEEVLTIRTEDIIKYERNCGTATIQLNLKKLSHSDDCYYYVLKIFPDTHSHVYSSNCLCFGDGYRACAKSIKDGRLDDFVDIVQQILRT